MLHPKLLDPSSSVSFIFTLKQEDAGLGVLIIHTLLVLVSTGTLFSSGSVSQVCNKAERAKNLGLLSEWAGKRNMSITVSFSKRKYIQFQVMDGT